MQNDVTFVAIVQRASVCSCHVSEAAKAVSPSLQVICQNPFQRSLLRLATCRHPLHIHLKGTSHFVGKDRDGPAPQNPEFQFLAFQRSELHAGGSQSSMGTRCSMRVAPSTSKPTGIRIPPSSRGGVMARLACPLWMPTCEKLLRLVGRSSTSNPPAPPSFLLLLLFCCDSCRSQYARNAEADVHTILSPPKDPPPPPPPPLSPFPLPPLAWLSFS